MAKVPASSRRTASAEVSLRQIAALPFRRKASGELEVLLLTSRKTHRFIIPKGWRMGAKKDWKAAEKEALEEGGVVGKIKRRPIGHFQYWKRLKGRFALVEVDVYPLKVEKRLKTWPEKRQRATKWLTARDAALLVDEPQLTALIRDFAGLQGELRASRDSTSELAEAH